MGQRQERGDARAHRIAHHMRLGDAEMPEQRRCIAGHLLGVIEGGIIGLAALPMTAIVERDHPVAGIAKRLQPAGKNPIDVGARSKAVNEQDRRTGRISLVEEGDIQPFMREVRKRRRIEIHYSSP
ncbi:hypothetical protein D3C72_1524410 [compost metagenome]